MPSTSGRRAHQAVCPQYPLARGAGRRGRGDYQEWAAV